MSGGEDIQFRHEYKHYLNYADYIALRGRLAAVMKRDAHVSEKGYYRIRSLYFDNSSDKALREKLDGISEREKFRLRCYDGDHSFIRLEKKVKKGGLGYKLSAPLTEEETAMLLRGETDWMLPRGEGIITELYGKMKFHGLRPRTIVDYIREPYVYPAGNVRVTVDHDIRTGVMATDMLDENIPTVAVCEGSYILEVKYDSFLPDAVRDVIQLRYREESAFSKYGSCRIFG